MIQNSNQYTDDHLHNHPLTPQESNQNSQNDEDEVLNLHDFLILCLNKWKWFAVSICLFLGIGVFYILSTPKTYTRTASVMINEDTDGGSQGIASALSDMGLFQSSVNVNNEMLAFQSPALIAEVIRQLDLQTDYTYHHNLKDITLYGDSCPISVSFLSIAPTKSAFMQVKLIGENKAEISDMVFGPDKIDSSAITVNLGDTVSTPLGQIAVNPGAAYSKGFSSPIKVTRYDLADAIETYKKRLSESLTDDKSTVIDFSFEDVSIQRADDFLNTLIDIYNEKWVDDKAQMAKSTSRFISERLRVIEQELGNVDSDIADYKGEHLVPDVAAASAMYMENANENTKQQMQVSTQIAISKFILDYVKTPETKGQLVP
ncbi:MAG: chromosome partitioning protein ParA, partial [Duncaniella sp.]|nr:chromosome partitioning protein ParA [Duncaniella sp.]